MLGTWTRGGRIRSTAVRIDGNMCNAVQLSCIPQKPCSVEAARDVEQVSAKASCLVYQSEVYIQVLSSARAAFYQKMRIHEILLLPVGVVQIQSSVSLIVTLIDSLWQPVLLTLLKEPRVRRGVWRRPPPPPREISHGVCVCVCLNRNPKPKTLKP